MSTTPRDLRHVVADNPRVLIVESSRMVRKLISDLLKKELPNVTVVESTGLKQARACLNLGAVDLVTTSLSLDDGDGLQVAKAVRDAAGQAYVPVIVVSSDVNSRLASRTLGDDVTDYFDKSAGFPALAAFVRGYIQPQPIDGARILYVEDSRVVALATKRMLAAQGLTVIHVDSAEAAIEYLKEVMAFYSKMGVTDKRHLKKIAAREIGMKMKAIGRLGQGYDYHNEMLHQLKGL